MNRIGPIVSVILLAATMVAAHAQEAPCVAHEIAAAAQQAAAETDAALLQDVLGNRGNEAGQSEPSPEDFIDTSCVSDLYNTVASFQITSVMSAAVDQAIEAARSAACTAVDAAYGETVGRLPSSVSFPYGYGEVEFGADLDHGQGDGPTWGGWSASDEWTGGESHESDWNPFAPLDD